MMEKTYVINGWEYGRRYFYDVGGFTQNEKESLDRGEIVTKNGNEFWIIERGDA